MYIKKNGKLSICQFAQHHRDLKGEKMNYLAHIYLSDNNEKNMLGNFLGDFVNKSLEDNYEDSIKNGIFMHQKLDSFTDSNPYFLSKKRISSVNRRLAGVLIDMFYDHFLAKNWHVF